MESPSEHLRNAMQLLRQIETEAAPAENLDLTAALHRLERALSLLEPN